MFHTLLLLIAAVGVVHGAPDPLAKCAEGYNIPGVTVRCWDDGTARKCIEGYVYTCVITEFFSHWCVRQADCLLSCELASSLKLGHLRQTAFATVMAAHIFSCRRHHRR